MRAAVYLRISQDREGRRLGVDRQREHCAELAARIGATITTEYCDNDRSASTLSRKRRPDFEAMLTRAERGEVDAILSYSTSRLTRRPAEIERVIPLGERYGVKIHTVKHGDYDLNSARGRRRAREDAARDAEEVEEAAERIRDEVAQRAEQGRYHGGPPLFGFANGTTVDPGQAELVTQWAGRVLAGGSVRGIAGDLNRCGVPSPGDARWSAWTVRRILTNPRMAGLRVLNGREFPAPHPPILPEPTWRAVRDILSSQPGRSGGNPTARKHIGTGLYVCQRCAPATVNSGYSGRGHLVYRCLTCWRSWRAGPLDGFVDLLVRERLGRGDLADLLPTDRPDLAALEQEAQGIRRRITTMRRDFMLYGADSEAELQADIAAARARLAAIDDRVGAALRSGAQAELVACDDPVALYDSIPPEQVDRRQAAVRAVMTITLAEPPRGRRWDPERFVKAGPPG